ISRGSDTIETVLPTGSSEATIIVSVSDAPRSGSLSTPTSRTLIRSPSLGTGPSPATGPSSPDADVREHDQQHDDDDADDPEASGRTRPAGIEERLPDSQQPPGQDEPVE